LVGDYPSVLSGHLPAGRQVSPWKGENRSGEYDNYFISTEGVGGG